MAINKLNTAMKQPSIIDEMQQVFGIAPAYPPLVGNRCGKANKTHWILFLK
jgi:hypothetical protein